MPRKEAVVFKSKDITITRHSALGGGTGPLYEIYVPSSPRGRWLKLTVDQLFDLTEALDDICDGIEDREETSRQKQQL